MILQASCPDSVRLKEHLEELLSEAEEAELITHLDACETCQQTLERLAAGGEGLLDVARKIGQEDELDFLSPADKPGLLGRLGPYEVLEVLGRGGMGVVLKAFDPALQRAVAIKVMAPQLAASATARQRFLREARAAAAVRHEHVVAIHAVAEIDGLPYLVMEYVAGTSLQGRLDRGGPLALEEVLHIGNQVATGLAAAHAQGLIHRDVKPANILLEDGTGRVALTDFGLARASDDAGVTQSGVVAGTPHYMAPEQARGEKVDHRADLFSLGSVLYAMCAGRPPFRNGGTFAVLKRVCDDTAQPVREVNPEVPDWLAAIIAKLHAKDPAGRFQSAAEVADLLSRHVAHLRQPSLVPLPPLALRRPSSRTRRRWAIAAAAALLIVPVSYWAVPQIMIRIKGKDGQVTEIKVPEGAEVTVEPAVGEIRRLVGHARAVCTVLFHPDGRHALSADVDNAVRLWDLQTGKEVRHFQGSAGGTHRVAFSPDGRRFLSAGADLTLRLWDLETGKEVRPFEGHTERIWCAAVSPDGRRALSAGGRHGGSDFAVRLWDVETGKELRRFEGHTDDVLDVAFSPDGRQALSCSGRLLAPDYREAVDVGIRLWDVETGKELRRFEGHTNRVESVVFSPDGRRVLSGSRDGTLRLWDVATGKELRCFRGHRSWVGRVAFSPDGRRALSASSDESILLWDVETGLPVHRFAGHTDAVTSIAFSPDGRRALSGSQYLDRSVRLWQLPPPEKETSPKKP